MSENDDNSVDRRPLVNLRVNLRQKARWEWYARRSDIHSSVSDLIRKSVEKEINTDDERVPTGQSVPSEIQSDLDTLTEYVEQLKADVSWLRSREEYNVEQLAYQIFESIEEVKVSEDDESAKQMGTLAGGKPHTVEAIADRLNTTPARVEEAIEFLKEQHMPIVRFDIAGETHWFKEE
jgi:hypothetical protein